MATMQGVVLPGDSTVELKEFPVPQVGPGQVLLEMKASSICGSDIRAIYREHLGKGPEAYQGVIAGHEPCGQVAKVGDSAAKLIPVAEASIKITAVRGDLLFVADPELENRIPATGIFIRITVIGIIIRALETIEACQQQTGHK